MDNFALSHPYENAIYLPATNTNYLNATDKAIKDSRTWPSTLQPSDLAFWTGKSNLFNHCFALHSVGSYRIGEFVSSPLFDRLDGPYCLVGDSGGYQIGKGTLKGLKNLSKDMNGEDAEVAWYDNKNAVTWITGALDTNFDYAMTIDMPLWATTTSGKDSPFHHCSEEQLLRMTLRNLDRIVASDFSSVKWLNVIQGTTLDNSLNWYHSVKKYPFSGWSLAGAASWRGGLVNFLHLLLTMRDDGAFTEGRDWIHMLGVSQPIWDVIFTRCQMHLREQNPKIQISYDSASPFITAGVFNQVGNMPKLGKDLKQWYVQFDKFDGVRSYADPTRNAAFMPNTSPISQHIYMHHLVIKDDDFESNRIDDISNQLLINHNIWIYLDAGRRANDIARNSFNDLPKLLANALTAIDQAFTSDDWKSFLSNWASDLDKLAPNKFTKLHPTT
jgi:hypothetical protein